MSMISGLKPVSTEEAGVKLKDASGEKTPKCRVIVPPGVTDPAEIAGLWCDQLGNTGVPVTRAKDGANVDYGKFNATELARKWLAGVTGDEDAKPMSRARKAGKRSADAPTIAEGTTEAV